MFFCLRGAKQQFNALRCHLYILTEYFTHFNSRSGKNAGKTEPQPWYFRQNMAFLQYFSTILERHSYP